MADFAAIRAGIAANLATLANPTKVQISAYRLDNPNPPTLQVMGTDLMVPTTFHGGGYSVPFLVQGFVGALVDRAAQENLDVWLYPTGATSVWEALESDRTLGGIVDDLAVIQQTGHRVYQFPNRPDVLGAEWAVQVEI